jgi:hypothetical protein
MAKKVNASRASDQRSVSASFFQIRVRMNGRDVPLLTTVKARIRLTLGPINI